MRLIDADALPVSKEYCVDEAGFGANFYVVHMEDIDDAPTIKLNDITIDGFTGRQLAVAHELCTRYRITPEDLKLCCCDLRLFWDTFAAKHKEAFSEVVKLMRKEDQR